MVLKILLLHWRDPLNPRAGGAENLLLKCVQTLVERGFQVDWFSPKFSSNSSEMMNGIRIIRRGGRLSVYPHALLYYAIHRGEYSLILESVTGVPWFVPLYCRRKHITVIYHLGKKETFFTELPAEMGLIGNLLAPFAFILERSLGEVYRSQSFLTFSSSTKEELVGMGIAGNRVSVVQEGIERPHMGPIEKYPRPTVVYVGRLVKNKGVQHLIDAMYLLKRRIPGSSLLVIGRGHYENQLRTQVREMQLEDTVFFLGYVDEKTKWNTIAKSHCLVLPSMREGWATPVFEAASVGVPAIGSNVVGISDSIIQGRTGYLVKFGDPREIADRLSVLLGDQALCRAMGEGAKKYSENFDIQRTKNGFRSVVESIIGVPSGN